MTEPFLGESPGVSSLNIHVTLAFLKWSALFQGACWTCNLFPLQWQGSLNWFAHVTWRYVSFSAVSGTESTSAYCSTKKTCRCVHASRCWHLCRALLGMPANARVCLCKINCKGSSRFSTDLSEMRTIIYLCIGFNYFFFNLGPVSLATGNISGVFEFFNLKYVFPDLYFKFICCFLAISN